MEISLNNPYVTTSHDQNDDHIFSVIMFVEEDSKVYYRYKESGDDPNGKIPTNSVYNLEFLFDYLSPTTPKGWYEINDLSESIPIDFNGKRVELISFSCGIIEEDKPEALFMEKSKITPLKKKANWHNGTIHRPR